MEYPSEEYWEVADYSQSYPLDDYSQSYESKSKLGRIWSTGLNIGKKMVVTGVVISSAPFVLPPLMALSALGVAFSVPAGFAFATYACSEKLMDKLLPMPSPPPLVEDGVMSTTEEEDRFYRDDVGKGYEEDEDIDAEEREFEGDTRKEIEMRIELVEEDNSKIDDYDRAPVNEIVEEDRYKEDIGEYKDEEIPLNISGISDEEMRRETMGLIEEMRNEGKYDQDKQDISAEETIKENVATREIPINDVSENKGDSILFVIPEEVKPEEDAKGAMKGSTSNDASSNLTSVGIEGTNEKVSETKPQVEKKRVVQVKTSGDHNATDVRLETSSDKTKGALVISDADARETADESGLDMFDHVTPSPDQTGVSARKTSAGVHEAPIEPKGPAPECAETTSNQDTTAGSGKVKSIEEKIWEQIHAMRTIVGYKVAPQSSAAEELKALYIFTGVEPPASSKGPVDPTDINEKLHFLMSIIGVK